MNTKIRKHLEEICKRGGWPTDDESLMEIVTEAKEIYTELGHAHRWYDEMIRVVEVEGMILGFNGYHTTGDHNASDLGLDPIQLDDVEEYKSKEVVNVVYVPESEATDA